MEPVEQVMRGLCQVMGRAALERLLDDVGYEAIDSLQLSRRAHHHITHGRRASVKKGRAA